MKITLTKTEAEKYFYNALCNGIIYVQSSYGVEISFEDDDYRNAKNSLKNKMKEDDICYEDVLMEILRQGGNLKLIDEEQENGEAVISLADVHTRVAKTQPDHLFDMIEEKDDAITADVILQTVFYGEVIFS